MLTPLFQLISDHDCLDHVTADTWEGYTATRFTCAICQERYDADELQAMYESQLAALPAKIGPQRETTIRKEERA